MKFPISETSLAHFPLLQHIPDPPDTLTYRGMLPSPEMKLLSVVGARKYSTYGKQVVAHLISKLRGYNVGIVSGLALGIDSLAHEAALHNNIYTLAIPGSGIDDSVIYPARHKGLAQRILRSSGGLLSEFHPTFTATKWSFAKRNRIMAGISHATLVIEATEKSGTLITARLATDYNRELLVVPGDIFSQNTAGPHQFLKLGATPVTTAEDILYALNIDPKEKPAKKLPFATTKDFSEIEQQILDALREPIDTDSLIRILGIETHKVTPLLMQMEINGHIINMNGSYRKNTQ